MKVNMNLDGRDHVKDKTVLSCSVKKIRGFREDNQLSIVLLELKPDLRMITRKLPLIVDMKETNIKRFPWVTGLGFQKDDVSGGTIVPFCSDSTDICSDSLHLFYETCALSNIPEEVINSGYMFKSLRLGRRTHHRMINLGEFLDKCSSVTESGNLLVSPSARWILDSIEASARRRSLISRTLFSKPHISDDRPTSSASRDMKTSQLLTSSTGMVSLLSGSPESLVTSCRKVISEAKASQELLLSCSSTKSTSSCCSTSSNGHLMTSATIRCLRKKNVPCFLFFSDCHEYMASFIKVKTSAHKGLDYIYLFHSWNGSERDSKNEADIIGKMKVSTSVLLSPNGSKSMETEFILFATDDEHIKSQKSTKITKNNRISKNGAQCLRLHNSRLKFGGSGFPFEDICETFTSDIRVIENVGQVDRLLDDFLPSNELAAIVVKDHGYDSTNGAIPSGWGLKFLERGFLVQDCGQIYTGNKCSSSKIVEALIPTGFHGGSSGTTGGGPSSLVERWISNGHCDCGGWDVGCPLKVLVNYANSSESSAESMPEDNDKSLQLSVQGAKQAEPTFKLLNLTEDMYAVFFQPTLSALQCFSIAVAMIHSQTPDLYPKL